MHSADCGALAPDPQAKGSDKQSARGGEEKVGGGEDGPNGYAKWWKRLTW